MELTSGRLHQFLCEEPIRYQDGTPVDAAKPNVEPTCSVRVVAKGLKCKYHNAMRRTEKEIR